MLLLLPITANPIVRNTVWSVPDDDMNTDLRHGEMRKIDELIAQQIGNDFGDGSEDVMIELLPPYGDLYVTV